MTNCHWWQLQKVITVFKIQRQTMLKTPEHKNINLAFHSPTNLLGIRLAPNPWPHLLGLLPRLDYCHCQSCLHYDASVCKSHITNPWHYFHEWNNLRFKLVRHLSTQVDYITDYTRKYYVYCTQYIKTTFSWVLENVLCLQHNQVSFYHNRFC